MALTRRQFLKISAVAGAGIAVGLEGLKLWALEPVPEIDNPLSFYPNRDWEKIYRDQYRYDSAFSWVCSPNDTHACRAKAYVRNGVVFRLGSEYNYETYADLYGNKATASWNPRQC
ncbi:MAG: twin-arginine translocation signal domain-containing protein, partial [Candidatus Omnitrophica bacterium]|nr:twin-arginine translocation signal domain-containing protein [Candidatus Omnitrophota bacterium]